MVRKVLQTFAHPVGILVYTAFLAVIVNSWALVVVVFGVELIALRHHHHEFPEHERSFFDSDGTAIVGTITGVLGGCVAIAQHSPSWALGAVLVACCVQLLSSGWHRWQHEQGSRCDAVLMMMAGALVALALTVSMIT